jgi:hypothetical protein
MIQSLSSTIIDQRKDESINAQSLRKTVAFRELNLIDEKTIEYQGKRIAITSAAFKSLLKLIGMSQQFAGKFEKLFNTEAKTQFINRMKDAMASNSGNLSNVTLILNPVNKTIIGFGKDESTNISNGQFIQVAEDLINANGMDVTTWSTDPVTGIVTIDAFNPKAEFGIQGMRDEVFTGGVTFQNNPIEGFKVMPYMNRQWCTNGLTTAMAQESYELHSLSGDNVNKFFEHLRELRKNNFAPAGFADRVREANNTPASIKEMEYAYSRIKGHAGERADNWIPFQENLNAYAKKGFETMSNAQKKMAKTNQSVWSLVNGMTHFSSHGQNIIDTNMQDAQAAQIQVAAGNILGKKAFDHENSMPDVFTELRQDGAILN